MSENKPKVGIVLLAAGLSARFGQNKLLADFAGKPLACHAMDAMRAVPAARCAVVTGYPAVAQLARQRGLDVIENDAPQLGQAHSIHLGVRAMEAMDAAMFLVGDQPLLTAESLRRLLDAFAAGEMGIACLQDATHSGNPAVFARRYFPALLAIEGDRGAKGVLRANAHDVLAVPCARADELADADDPAALTALAGRI